MIVVAHSGHWAVQLLYAAPLVVMAVMLVVGRMRQQRDAKRLEAVPPGKPSASGYDDHEEERDAKRDRHDRQ
jgi:hypothetical protein